ncbi:MAG TPA: DUF2255 family protein [Gryllotalpicola sp.]
MSEWTPDELTEISQTEEVEVTPAAADGAATQSVIMWAVTVGDEVFVRSARGVAGRWYQRASKTGRGGFTAGGVSREVGFVGVTDAENQAVTDAYNTKYASQPAQFRTPMVEGPSLEATLKVVPA